MSTPLSGALRLAAACCQWPLSAEGEERVRAIAGELEDWAGFDAVISRNRIRPLAWHALSRAGVAVPEPFREKFARYAVDAARRSLFLARESLHLQQAFAGQGLPVMIIKGIPLAILAYGELGMKEAVDVDILVPPQFASAGRQILVDLGYKTQLDKLGAREMAGYARHIHEAAFSHPGTGMNVDLHWMLVPNRKLLSGIGSNPQTQDIAIPGGTLRTLADEPLFAYLCVHGARCNWNRLKWLADVGAFLSNRSEAEVVRLHEAATAYGVGRCASVALLLCRRLFGLALKQELATSLEQDPIVRALANNVLAGLSHREGTADPEPFNAPWFRLTAAQFFLVPGPAHAFDQLRVFWNSPDDRAVFLPRGFEFGFHVLRLPRWLGRIATRAFERKRA